MLTEPEGRVVVVVAHPDDESFGCGSLIAAAVGAGASVTVICATRGEAGERLPDPETDGVPLGLVRERELVAAGAVLGVESIELLEFADSGFDGDLPEHALCAVPVDDLAFALEARLAHLGASVVVILDGSDGHRDHKHIRAAIEIAFENTVVPFRLVQSCLANSLMRLWVGEARAMRPDTAYLDIDLDELGRPDAELTAVDASAYLEIREEAIACHRSQQSPYDGLSPELRRAFLSTDFVVTS